MQDNFKSAIAILFMLAYGLSTPLGVITSLVCGDAWDVFLSFIVPFYGTFITVMSIFG